MTNGNIYKYVQVVRMELPDKLGNGSIDNYVQVKR